MWLGKSLHLLCIFHFGILCLSALKNDVCENYICSEYVGGSCGLSESGLLCVVGKLCPVGFLVVCKCSSVLLQSIVMSCVDDG